MRLMRVVTLRYLAMHRPTFLVAVAGIAVGVATVVAVQLTTRSAVDSFAATVAALEGPTALSITAPGTDLDERVFDRLAPLYPIARVLPVLQATALALAPGEPASRGEALDLHGIDLVGAQAPGVTAAAAKQGLSFDALEPDAILLTGPFLKRRGLRTGDALDLVVNDRRRTLKVAGQLPIAPERRFSSKAFRTNGLNLTSGVNSCSKSGLFHSCAVSGQSKR